MKKILVLIMLTLLMAGYAYGKEAGTTIVDQAGRKVVVPVKVEKIVCLWPEATRILYALEADEKIVGLDGDSKKCPILVRAFPKIKDVTEVGSAVNGTLSIEKLAQLNPDIIFMRTDDPELADRIQDALGAPVACVRIHPPPARQASFDIITFMGEIVGRKERGEAIRTYLEQRLSAITSIASKIPDTEKPKVYQAFAFDLLKTIGYFDVLEFAGGNNAAQARKEAWYTVSLEDLLRWNPHIIILHGFGKFMPEDVMNEPSWQQIEAVKGGKVYRLTLGWFGWDPAGFVVNVMQNAKVFHPDKFTFNVEKEANEIFGRLYGVDELYSTLKSDYKLSDI